MAAPQLYVTTGFATGTVIAPLSLVAVTDAEAVDLNDSMTAVVALPFLVPVTQRTPLRLFGADGVQREYRVRRIVESSDGKTAEIEGGAPWLDIATARIIRARCVTAMVTGPRWQAAPLSHHRWPS